jgi:hypothetical protein
VAFFQRLCLAIARIVLRLQRQQRAALVLRADDAVAKGNDLGIRLRAAGRRQIRECVVAKPASEASPDLSEVNAGGGGHNRDYAENEAAQRSQDRTTAASGVPKRTLAGFERGETAPRRATLAANRAALQAAGVEFIAETGGGPGVRLRKDPDDQGLLIGWAAHITYGQSRRA